MISSSERGLRRSAEQQGCYLRRANVGDVDAGSFVLVDTDTREVVHGPGLSIEQVAEWLCQNSVQVHRDEGR